MAVPGLLVGRTDNQPESARDLPLSAALGCCVIRIAVGSLLFALSALKSKEREARRTEVRLNTNDYGDFDIARKQRKRVKLLTRQPMRSWCTLAAMEADSSGRCHIRVVRLLEPSGYTISYNHPTQSPSPLIFTSARQHRQRVLDVPYQPLCCLPHVPSVRQA
jgi:hypothetical protein